MEKIQQKLRSISFTWKSLYTVTFLACFLYFFMEWLFIITKPSFFSPIELFYRKVEVLLFSSSFFTGISFTILLLIFLASTLPWLKRTQKIFLLMGSFLPVMIITSLSLLLIDNFTYTLFKFGIVSTDGWLRVFYMLGFILLFFYYFSEITRLLSWLAPRLDRWKSKTFIIPAICAFVGICLAFTYHPRQANNGFLGSIERSNNKKLPNIILITADGLDAIHTSLYGYERETTPRIDGFAKTSLVAENSFTNAGSTAGSLVSIFTGKYPTTTRVLFPPDILKNEDSYQHLPGILHSMGYYTAQYSVKDDGDAYTQNLLEGFDISNGQTIQQGRIFNLLSNTLQTDDAYFITEISNRISDRLRHIFFNTKMVNRYALVQGYAHVYEDTEKINSILKLLDSSQQPVFAHVHWMGTHGVKFTPQIRTFSKDKNINAQKPSDDDFYDDSILDFDAAVGQVIDHLTASGLMDNTILIIGSDHGRFVNNKKIPLVMHFPNDQYAGKILSDTQNIDIAPTILDYLGIAKPGWMVGKSLLSGEPGNRPIYGVRVGAVEMETGVIKEQSWQPPYYQFGIISMVYCNKWFQLDFENMEWKTGEVQGYIGECGEGSSISDEQAFTWLVEHLKKDGFDTSRLVGFSVVNKK